MMNIRPVQTLTELKEVEAIQKMVWGGGDEIAVPDHTLMAVQKHGGVLIAAFEEQTGRMIGFVFGLVGREPDGRVYHHSHMLAVLPGYQDHDLGRRLKLAQREAVLAQGIDRMTWTFDPLQSRNARLNFGKLGVVCRTYIRNYYGEMTDSLNAGLSSDRFEVEWRLSHPRVIARISDGPDTPQAAFPDHLPVLNRSGDLLRPGTAAPFPADGSFLVQIPADLQQVKQTDLNAARRWREQTRLVFEAAFSAGKYALDYWREPPFGYYLIDDFEA